MNRYQKEFIQLAIESNVLKFGEFTLKSGRVSPYFFNAGQFYTGSALAKLGDFYAQALKETGVPFDMVFGPAYKGIPLATTTAVALANNYGIDAPFAYNRKEAKTHGEGGTVVGAPLVGNVAIIDDVITAGTAIREVLALLEPTEAKPSVIVVGLNRQEKGPEGLSAIEELEQQTGVKVVSIVDLSHVIAYLQQTADTANLDKMRVYRDKYGV